MNKALVKDFQTRIVNAGRGELLIINYEMLLAQLDEVIEAIELDNDVAYGKAMENAFKLLRELSGNLDYSYEISKELISIYIYINKKFIDTSLSKKVSDIEEAKKLLAILLEGWKLTEFKEEEPIITNGQKVYAGLTYGKNDLNVIVDHANERGFKA